MNTWYKMNLIFCGDSFPVVEHPGGGQTEVGSEEVNVDGVTGVQDLGISRQNIHLFYQVLVVLL